MDCLDEQSLRAVMLGGVGAMDVEAVEQHVDICPACRRKASSVARANAIDSANTVGGLPSDSLLASGEVVGRYVVFELIGAGSMSVVYAAYDPQLDRKISLKLLRADVEGALGKDAAARLTTEAQAMARLSHPNVAVVHDVGTFRGQLFIAMEYVSGGTLERWLRTARTWQQVLTHFAAAGRGLDAAHQANLVHRDFKPSNVLVSTDGVVRVIDFGLASIASHPDPSAGPLVGTPSYMSPEQLAGRPADARSDQFSFCVSLHHALYGVRPFPAQSLAQLAEAMKAPLVAPNKEVPAWIWNVLLKGLSRDPQARFGSMGALVAALEKNPQVARRRRLLFAAASLVVLGLAATTVAVTSRAANRCAGAPQKLAGVWDDRVRARMQGAFKATGKPFADAMFGASAEALDLAAARWTQTYREVCEATWSRGEQSEALLDLRMACLENRRTAIQALTTLLASADGDVVARALGAAENLEPSAACSTASHEGSGAQPTPAERQQLAALYAGAGEVRALLDTGQYAAARKKVEGLAVATGDRALQAEAGVLLARAQQKTGQAAAAEETLFRAIAFAEEADAPRSLTQAWVNLVFVQGYLLAHVPDAHRSAMVAHAVLNRMGGDLDLEAELANATGSTFRTEGKLSEAEQAYRQALALREKARGSEDPMVAAAWANLASLLDLKGDAEASLLAHQRALAVVEKRLGPDHPDTALELNNIALVEENRSHDADALALFTRALAIRERALGLEHPMIATSATNVCMVLVHLGRVEEALVQCRRAVKIAQKNPGPRHPTFASVNNSLGVALLAHGELAEARAAFEQALSVREGSVGADHASCAYDLLGLGQLWLQQKDAPKAIGLFERALALREKPPVNSVLHAEAQQWLSRATWDSDRPRAQRLASQAREELVSAKSFGTRLLQEQTRWEAAR